MKMPRDVGGEELAALLNRVVSLLSVSNRRNR